MGTGKVTARRGADGAVEYDTSQVAFSNSANGGSANGSSGTGFSSTGVRLASSSLYKKNLEKGKAAALAELQGAEEAAIRSKTSALSATVGGVTGTGAGYSNAATTSSAPEGNPGISDPESQGDIDLSTSDTTARRKAGYRRDNGIRI